MKNQKVSTWLGTAVIIIFAITVGVLLWKVEKCSNWSKEQNQIITHQPKVAKTDQIQQQEREFPEIEKQESEQLSNITKNWKTFRDEQYGFEFKYPRDYSTVNHQFNKDIDEVSVVSNGKCFRPFGAKCITTITVISSGSFSSGEKECAKVKDSSYFSINGIKMVYCPADKLLVYIQTKEKNYAISTGLYPIEEEVQIVQGIYSTFKEIN